MATITTIRAGLDGKMKVQATEAMAGMGLSVSSAVRVLLPLIVVDQQLPFGLNVPNAETRAAMDEADEIARMHRDRLR